VAERDLPDYEAVFDEMARSFLQADPDPGGALARLGRGELTRAEYELLAGGYTMVPEHAGSAAGAEATGPVALGGRIEVPAGGFALDVPERSYAIDLAHPEVGEALASFDKTTRNFGQGRLTPENALRRGAFATFGEGQGGFLMGTAEDLAAGRSSSWDLVAFAPWDGAQTPNHCIVYGWDALGDSLEDEATVTAQVLCDSDYEVALDEIRLPVGDAIHIAGAIERWATSVFIVEHDDYFNFLECGHQQRHDRQWRAIAESLEFLPTEEWAQRRAHRRSSRSAAGVSVAWPTGRPTTQAWARPDWSITIAPWGGAIGLPSECLCAWTQSLSGPRCSKGQLPQLVCQVGLHREPDCTTLPLVSTGNEVTRQEVRALLRELIASAEPGDRLPSERGLSLRWDAARMTVRHATDALIAEGLVVRRRGSGTYVLPPPVVRFLGLTSFTQDMRDRGLVPSSRLLDFEAEAAEGTIAARLRVPVGETVQRFTRLRMGSGEPMAIETVWIRSAFVPGLARADLDGSLYELLASRYGLVPGSADVTIEPLLPDVATRQVLDVPEQQACLLMRMTDADRGGRVMMVADCIYRGDRYQLSAHVPARAFTTTLPSFQTSQSVG